MLLYYTILIISLVVGFAAQAGVKSKFAKYKNVAISWNLTGREAALKMLADNGVTNVTVTQGSEGGDHFDPRTNSIALSPSNYNVRSIKAAATACHEAGHALQYATHYKPLFLRASLVPIVNLCSNIWIIVFFIGVFMQLAGFTLLACIIYGMVVLFQVVTLPVEFNASHRGLAYMSSIGLPQAEVNASKSILWACAMTYVAAAIASALQLVMIVLSSER